MYLNRKILIIDDDPLTNKFNEMIIRKLHPEIGVKTLLSGKEGIDYFKETGNEPPQLILLDLNMPVMNGWEFMDEFINMGYEIKIALVTSSDDPNDVKKAGQYNLVEDYLVKPLSKENLSELFAKHFKE